MLMPIHFSSLAQWTDDTEENTPVSQVAGEKYVTHIAATPGGKYFISWYGGTDNLNMNLALLDSAGYAEWENPLVVSSHTQNTWVADYTLEVDSEGNAILAFSDVRNGNADLVVYKISQSGNQLFGTDGVQLTETAGDEFFPTFCVTDSDEIVLSWQRENDENAVEMVLQRIDSEGVKLWGSEGIVFTDPVEDFNTPLPIHTTNDEAIVLYYRQTGPFFSPIRTLWAQRFDVDGNEVWDNPTQLCGETFISGFVFPQAISDGNGGLVTSWQDDRDENQLGNVAVQHLLEDGSLQFPVDGIELTNPGTMGHYSPQTAGMDDEGNIAVYWRTTSSSQGQSGLKAQRVSPDGSLQWGNSGIEILPIGSHVQLVSDAELHGDSSWVCYAINPGGDQSLNEIYLHGLDAEGEIILGTQAIATANNQKSDIELSSILEGRVVAAWVNNAVPNRVKAQAYQLWDPVNSVWEQSVEERDFFKQRGDYIHLVVGSGVSTLELFNLEGKRIRVIDSRNRQIVKLPQDLPHGIYVLVGTNQSGRVLQSEKIIW